MYIRSCHIHCVYVVKEVESFWGLGQLMGVAHNRTQAQAIQTTGGRKLSILAEICSTGTFKK